MKITIIGTGNIDTSVAYTLIIRESVKEIILIDINDDLFLAKELELSQGIAALNLDIELICTKEYSHAQNFQITLFTAGSAKKDGQSRDGLLQINANIMLDCAKRVKRFNEEPFFIILTNPVDFLLSTLYKNEIFNVRKTVAMAGALDNAHFRYELTKKLKTKTSSVDTRLMGLHNDDMVLLESHLGVGNCKLTEPLSEGEFEDAESGIKTGGAKVTEYLKGSAYLAPASACLRILEAMRPGESLPTSVILNGEFGIKNKAFGVVARLRPEGIREIMYLALVREEREKLEESPIRH